MPLALAFFEIAPSFPCDEWLRYQIHMPLPASGFFASGGSAVWETAPLLSGPVAIAATRATAATNGVVLRWRKRMIRGYEPRNTALQGKLRRGAWLAGGAGPVGDPHLRQGLRLTRHQVQAVDRLGEAEICVDAGDHDAGVDGQELDAHERDPHEHVDHEALVEDQLENVIQAARRGARDVAPTSATADGLLHPCCHSS